MKDYYVKIRAFFRSMKRENISIYAASSAFFIFLSFIPLVMLLSAVITYTPLTQQDLIALMELLVPQSVSGFVESVILDVYERAQTLLPVAAVILLWTAGKGVLSIFRGLNAINKVEEHRGFFRLRLLSMFYTLVVLVAIVLGLGILSFGNLVMNVLTTHFETFSNIIALFFPFRFIVFWVVMTIIFSLIYAYVPNRRLKVKEQIAGASFAAVAWSVYSFAFSLYLRWGNSFDVYGSLAILIVLMVWLYFCMYIVFVGAYINRYLFVKS